MAPMVSLSTWRRLVMAYSLRTRLQVVREESSNKIKEELIEEPRKKQKKLESKDDNKNVDLKRQRKVGAVKIEYEDDDDFEVKKESKSVKWEPKNWKQMLENIERMRAKQDAPVDTMGCDKCPDETEKAEVRRWQSLVSLMLSSQTKDQVTFAAMNRLKDHGLTIENILNTEKSVLEQLIYPVGFYKRKAEYLKKTAQILKDDFAGDIPNTAEGLCDLPGVGPKMAHLCMKTAWGQLTGIGVDTHVHRIANRLKWVQKPTKTPEATRLALEDWLPKELWNKINHLLVGFGQQTCLPTNPKCQLCLNKDICPSSKYKRSN